MIRWNRGYRCYGNPQVVVAQIVTLVQTHDLGKYVPFLQVEKRARPGEFYLFLTMMSESKGVMPIQVEAALRNISALGPPQGESIEDEEIRRFVGAKLDIHDFGQRIPYATIWRSFMLEDDDPFDLDIPSSAEELHLHGSAATIAARSEIYDRLLQWLSVIGIGSWEMFRHACQVLGLDNQGEVARRIIRRLRLLGHLEMSADGKRWSVAPSVLVNVASSAAHDTYVLCGARDAKLVHALALSARVELHHQVDGNAPAAVVVDFSESPESVSDLPIIHSDRLRLGGRVSDKLAQVLPSTAHWQQELERLKGVLPHMYDLKWFDGTRFIDRAFDGAPGLYQFWESRTGRASENRPTYTLFYDAPTNRWLRGDWYGLRFLALQVLGQQGRVHYERSTARLAVPEIWRWPELYERALVLASGRLPVHSAGWVIYDAVSPDAVGEMCAKLNLVCEEK